MPHLLVTNDFPPKVGGIQTYLWELWRRLPDGECTVFTTAYPGSEAFDAEAPMRIVRSPRKALLPSPSLTRRLRELASESGADLVVIDPVLPLGGIGRHMGLPYCLVLHGAEITVPGRLPLSRLAMARVLRGARGSIAAGEYPAAEARRILDTHATSRKSRRSPGLRPIAATALPSGSIPPIRLVMPGVDTRRFRPLAEAKRREVRRRFGIAEDAELVVSVSRLVPRKGMDTLVRAAARLASSRPSMVVAIAGDGRDAPRIRKIVDATGAPVRFLGSVAGDDLPQLYGCADLFVMACRDRWGGLEQEGFGVVFLEAAACGVPQIAGRSGGSHEAVEHGATGLVLRRSDDPVELADSIARVLGDRDLAKSMAEASRRRAEADFGYDSLASTLLGVLRDFGSQ